MAIELDRYLNNSKYSSATPNDYLDYDATSNSGYVANQLRNKHMTMGYPGEAGTYFKGGTVSKHNYYYMGHRAPVQNEIPMAGYDTYTLTGDTTKDAIAAWHHIKVNYTPPASGSTTAKLTLAINDKFVDGTIKPLGQRDSKTYDIDISKLNSASGKVRWGFTAATGSPQSGVQDVAMVIEKMPSVLDIKKTTTLTDVTKNISSYYDEVNQVTNNTITATDGDDLRFDYNLNYASGFSESDKISSTIGLPEHVDYVGDAEGNIGQVTYKNSSGTQIVQKINKSDIKEVTVTVPGINSSAVPTYKKIQGLELTIPSLTKMGETATISINGKAKAPDSDKLQTTTVASEHSSYSSTNFTGDTMTPEFKLENEMLQITTTDSLNQELTMDDTLHISGKASYLKNSTFDGNDLTAKAAVYDDQGKSINADGLQTTSIAKGQTTGNFSIDYPLNNIQTPGTYTVKVADNKKLVITRNVYDNYFMIEKDKSLSLQFMVKYDDSSSIDSGNVTTYLSIDGQTATPQAAGPNPGSIQTEFGNSRDIDLKSLDYGVHTATIYADDGKHQSNTLNYKFKVIDKGLVLTAQKKTINVTNNDPVSIGWNAKYSSDVDNVNGDVAPKSVQRLTLELKTEKDTDFKPIATSSISALAYTLDKDQNFSFDLNPINYGSVSSPDLDVLQEGRNELRFSVRGDSLTSNTETIVINVPKLTPKINLASKDIYFSSLSSVSGSIKLNFTVQYLEDATYTSKTKLISMNLLLEDGSKIKLLHQTADASDYSVIPIKTAILPGQLNASATNNLIKATLVITDPYNREAEANVNFIYSSKMLELTVDKESSFQDIGPTTKPNELVKRNGNWIVDVNSLGYKWNLNAQSSGLFSNKDASYYEPLVFLDDKANSQSLSNNPLIASRDSAVTSQNEIDNISEDWTDDSGILLQNSVPNLAGEYKGSINWTLTEAL